MVHTIEADIATIALAVAAADILKLLAAEDIEAPEVDRLRDALNAFNSPPTPAATTEVRLRKSDWIKDWYVLDPDAGISIEGTWAEWNELVDALAAGKHGHSFTRCGFFYNSSGHVLFYSPRNSASLVDHIIVPLASIPALITQMRSILDQHKENS